jgi:hypothetical protein
MYTLKRKYDTLMKVVFEALRHPLAPPVALKRKSGFDLVDLSLFSKKIDPEDERSSSPPHSGHCILKP